MSELPCIKKELPSVEECIERIESIREGGFTLQDIADLLGIHRVTLSNMINGTVNKKELLQLKVHHYLSGDIVREVKYRKIINLCNKYISEYQDGIEDIKYDLPNKVKHPISK